MKKISRLLALLMALAMAVSLAACSNDSGDVSAPASNLRTTPQPLLPQTVRPTPLASSSKCSMLPWTPPPKASRTL